MLAKARFVLALAVAALPAVASAWSDDFTGGFHNDWSFGFLDDLGDPPAAGVQSAIVVNDILLVADTVAAEAGGGGGSSVAFGFVDEVFETSFVRGSVNVGASPTPVDQAGLLARGDAADGTAYLFGIDFGTGVLLLARSDVPSEDPTVLASGTPGAFQRGQSYWLELDAVGSQITGRAYTAAGGTLLDTLAVVDATYSAGVAGVVTRAYDIDGNLAGVALHATFDDVSAVPEPSSAPLLGAGLALLGAARRRARSGTHPGESRSD
jgi:hypothetical protein